MAFWDVGATNRLVGAPISGDQSALSEMQDWLDKEAKRKRDDAEAQRKREEEAAYGRTVASEQESAIGRKKAKLKAQNLELLKSTPLAADPTALAAAEARLAGNGEYVDPETGDIYETFANFQQIKAKKLIAAREARLKENEAAERTVTGKAEQAARARAKAELKRNGLADDEAEAFLSEQDPRLAQQKVLDVASKKRDPAGLLALTQKIMDLGSGQTLIDLDPEVQKARTSSGTRLALRGIDAERAYQNQQQQLASIDPYERDMAADDEYLQGLADASARLRVAYPMLKDSQDPFAEQIKQIQNSQLRREMAQASRTKGIDAGMFAQTTGAYQRLDKASAEAAYSKMELEEEKTRRALGVARIRAKSAADETERKYWERQVDVLQNRETIIGANKRQLIQSGGEIIAATGGSLADMMREGQAADPAQFNLEGQQGATTDLLNRAGKVSSVAGGNILGYTRPPDAVRPKSKEELTTVEAALARLRELGINIGTPPTVTEKGKPGIGPQAPRTGEAKPKKAKKAKKAGQSKGMENLKAILGG